jgi:RNA polymerase sigma-70 factor (ECF subfamily)
MALPSHEFLQHERWLRLVVLARVGERQAVDEVMQEIAVAVAKISSKGEVTRVAGWLYRVAVRQSLLYCRSRGRERKLQQRFVDQSRCQDPFAPDALTWLLERERASLVRQAVGRLPPREAEMVLLKYAENWSAAQLASHLGTTVSAVEARLHRARQRLRAELLRLNAVETVVKVD